MPAAVPPPVRRRLRRLLPAAAGAAALLGAARPSSPAPQPPAPQPPAAAGLVLLPESRLFIDGGSTLRRWSCAAQGLEADVAAEPDAPRRVLAGERAVRALTLRVPVRGITCPNGTMTGHLRKAMRADAHPAVVFRLTAYEVAPSGGGADAGADGEAVGRLTGALTIGDSTHTVTVEARARADAGGTGGLRVTGAHPLRMSAYGVRPPTLMLGALRVDDAVTIRFDLRLAARPAA